MASISKNDKDKVLEKTFERIKNDMTSLKEGQHQQGVRISEVSQALKDAKSDLVTVDKFNILKIKIGELNESMKKVWDNEKKLEDLDKRSVGVSDFDKKAVDWNNDIKRLQSDLASLEKDAASQDQLKGLASDTNGEFRKVRKAIEELRNVKDLLTKAELENRTKSLIARSETNRKAIAEIRKESKRFVAESSVQEMVKDINSEFDSLKKTIKSLDDRSVTRAQSEKGFRDVDHRMDKLDKRIDETRQRLIKGLDSYAKGIESAIDDFAKRAHKKMDLISTEISDFQSLAKKEHKTFMTRSQGENLVDDVNKEFNLTKKDIASMRDEFAKAKKDLSSKDDLAAAFTGLGNAVKQLQDDMDKRLEDVRSRIRVETDRLDKLAKDNAKDLVDFRKESSKTHKTLVQKAQLEAELDAIAKEFENMHASLSSVQDKMLTKKDGQAFDKDLRSHDKQNKADYAEKVHFEKLAETVAKLEEVLALQKTEIKDKKKELKQKDKELKVYAKQLKASKKAIVEASPKALYKEPFRKTRIIGNIFIGLAFALVILAILFWFTGLDSLTTGLSVASVISFILGIALKITVAVKAGNHDPKMTKRIVSAHAPASKGGKAKKSSKKASKSPKSKKRRK